MASILKWASNAAHTVGNDINQILNTPAQQQRPTPQQPHPSIGQQLGPALQAGAHMAMSPFVPAIKGIQSDFSAGQAGVGLLTGNKVAAHNAWQASKSQYNQSIDPARGLVTRPAAELATSLAPRQVTYHPGSAAEKAVFGNTPIQNIQKKTINNYQTHPNLNVPARVSLAAGEAGLSIAQDAPVAGGALKAAKIAATSDAVKTAKAAAADSKVGQAVAPKYAGLPKKQIIMDTSKLDTLNNAKQILTTNSGSTAIRNQVNQGLHDIKNQHGLDFITGSRAARVQRLNQYLEKNGEAIPQLQAKMAQPRLKPLGQVGGGAINDSPIRKALQNDTPTPAQAPSTPKPTVIENKLTTGGKAGRQNLSPETQAQLSGEHVVRNTQALQDTAVANADKAGLDQTIQQAHEALAVPAGKIDDATVAHVQQAIVRADAAGRTQDAVALHDGLSEHLTKQGQTIQAASLLYRLSPQGQLYKAMRDLKKGGTTVTPDMEQHLRGLSDAIKHAPDNATKSQATAAFHKYVADNLPQNAANQALSVWKAGLLSGVKTQAGNFTSNATFGALKKISDVPATLVDHGLSLVTGQRTKTLTGRGGVQGFGKGIKTGTGTMKTGIDARNISGGKYETHGELHFKNGAANALIAKPTNLVFRGMNAADQPFYYAAEQNTLADLAKADGLNRGLKGRALDEHINRTIANPPENLAEAAKLAAQKAVLGQDSKISQSFSKFSQAHPAAQILAPFVKVPTNFLTRTLDFSPAGPIKTAVQQIRAGKFDQRALSESIGEGATGTGLIYLGAELANHNLVSGQYPHGDPKEAQRWKAEGTQPNSVRIYRGKDANGKDKYTWLSLNYLGPVGMLFGAGKDYHDALAKGDKKGAAAIASAAGAGKNLTGQSFLTGFSGFANAINDPQRSAKSFINSQVGSVIPSIANDAANLLDKNQRETNNPVQAIQSRVPVARNSLPVKQDVYGNLQAQRTSPLNQLANPLKPSDSRTTTNPVLNEVARLHNADPNNKDLQVTPEPIKKKFTVDGQNITLNDQQVHDLQHQVGQYTQQQWGNLIGTKQYQAMSDVDKANALNKLRQDASTVATRQYVTANNLAQYKKAATAKQLSLATDGNVGQYLNGSKASSADLYKSPDAEYKALQAKYQDNLTNNRFSSPAAKIKAENALAQAKVGASFDKNVRDLYGLNKSELTYYMNTDPNGKALVDKVIAYGDAQQAAGFGKNKFRNSKGAVSLSDATTSAKKSSGPKVSRSGGSRSAKLPKLQAIKTPKLKTIKSPSYKVAKLKSPKMKTTRAKIPSYAIKTPKVTKKAQA